MISRFTFPGMQTCFDCDVCIREAKADHGHYRWDLHEHRFSDQDESFTVSWDDESPYAKLVEKDW